MLNTYYHDELRYLRELGKEFAQAHPESARFLGESGGDPDVERLLEGVAFLTGRIRQKLDDELPEVSQALLEQLWPQYLCPWPGLCIMQAEHSRSGDLDVITVPAGSMIDSASVDGTRCRFRISSPIRVLPAVVGEVALRTGPPGEIVVTVQCRGKATVAQLAAAGGALRLHMAGAYAQAAALHACLTRYATAIIAETTQGGSTTRVILHSGPATAVGLGGGSDENLLPGPGAALPALASLGEYFAFPQRFLFADVPGLARLAGLPAEATTLTLRFPLSMVPTGIGSLGADSLLLGCAPAANIFAHHADPVQLDPLSSTYRLRAASSNADHAEIHSVTAISGLVRGRPTPRAYRAWTASRPDTISHEARTYAVRRRPTAVGFGADVMIEIPEALGATDDETLSIDIFATNRRLPSALGPGEITQLEGASAGRLKLRNLNRPTPCAWPPLGRDLEWRLVALLALNHRSLTEVSALRTLLELHHPRTFTDPQVRQTHQRLLDGLERISVRTGTALNHGLPVRGVEVELSVREDRFDGDGDRHLFSLVLDDVLAQHVALNSYLRLQVSGTLTGATLTHAARSGRAKLL